MIITYNYLKQNTNFDDKKIKDILFFIEECGLTNFNFSSLDELMERYEDYIEEKSSDYLNSEMLSNVDDEDKGEVFDGYDD